MQRCDEGQRIVGSKNEPTKMGKVRNEADQNRIRHDRKKAKETKTYQSKSNGTKRKDEGEEWEGGCYAKFYSSGDHCVCTTPRRRRHEQETNVIFAAGSTVMLQHILHTRAHPTRRCNTQR